MYPSMVKFKFAQGVSRQLRYSPSFFQLGGSISAESWLSQDFPLDSGRELREHCRSLAAKREDTSWDSGKVQDPASSLGL